MDDLTKKMRVYVSAPSDVYYGHRKDVLRALENYRFGVISESRKNGSVEIDIYKESVRSELSLQFIGSRLASELKSIDPNIRVYKQVMKSAA
ncbi:MAG: hypothetical protein HZB67_03320 [Candidatus Aenigmarchaeota archaeon]|nr:hypothetical protein [Candidatus Aenigmarchaeota archaeon]